MRFCRWKPYGLSSRTLGSVRAATLWRHGMQGATLQVLNEQWQRAMLDGDWAAVDRIDAARRKIESLPVRSCVWAGSEECRHCEAVCAVAEGAA